LAELRLNGAVRSAIIVYGIAAYAFLFPRADSPSVATGALQMLLAGIALQVLFLLVRGLVSRYERAHGLEGQIAPTALYIFELLVDGVTVLLFALATLQGILRHADSL
jgi:hypothetical protein